ncbi:hypothetical protein Q7O56_16330 [Pseudomonas protegens]|uniref:hypothetical protein n=1 Tax=Pseudomonas protegens TaxID=380021 RepID=UPI00274E7F2B|nr:hypothetical protein [Pseudomonas protegens]MDP9510623.1 hypothetical protein [Pseudomonas protegens]
MDQYLPLKSNLTDTPILLIDGNANVEDIYFCTQQRLRAAANLLETLIGLNFLHADPKDVTHIVNALYLLVQDSCDLLEATQLKVS